MKEGATKLSQAEKRALRKFVRRSNGQLQAETVCDGPPMISENTCLRLCSDYHINPQKTMQELAMEVPPGEAFHHDQSSFPCGREQRQHARHLRRTSLKLDGGAR